MKRIRFTAALLLLCLLLSGCGGEKSEDRPWPEEVCCSNLSDSESRELLSSLMTAAGIEEARQKNLFSHIEQINALTEPGELTEGFQNIKIGETLYEPYDLQERWQEKYPDFPGYNCRITAWSLFSGFIELENCGDIRDDFTFMDEAALDYDSSAVPEGREKFLSLYSPAPTEAGRDINVHLKNFQQNWKDRGLNFRDNDSVSLISVVFHDNVDGDQLFVGHTGLLFPGEDGKLYFLEKIAFQEPYRLCRFESRGQLSDYLMAKYDNAFNQTTAAPMVLENYELIEGWRSRSGETDGQ